MLPQVSRSVAASLGAIEPFTCPASNEEVRAVLTLTDDRAGHAVQICEELIQSEAAEVLHCEVRLEYRPP